MPVYIDDAFIPYRNMKMCHMIADTQDELLAMVDKIKVQRKWIQYPRTWKEHFDICSSKRDLAIRNGAIPVTYMELGMAEVARRKEGVLRFPERQKKLL